ncbi:MAG: 50S ribosomal protein L29 [Desulfovibrio sp.]|nr:50S ribosomal protein L29 [Desulfovibrio sp.]
MRTELARKKVSGKAVREFDGKDAAGLQTELADARKELFNLRFRHATGQLQEVADLAATRRRIARLLTLIRQKEVGA